MVRCGVAPALINGSIGNFDTKEGKHMAKPGRCAFHPTSGTSSRALELYFHELIHMEKDYTTGGSRLKHFLG